MKAVLCIVGKSGAGKTTFLEKLVRELKRLGYRVAVVKHAPHGFDIDQPGKDSWRLTQAGSDVVALSSPEKMAFVERVSEELSLDRIVALVEDKVDIVLMEGYKHANAAKIEVSRCERSWELLCSEEELLAIVSDHRFPAEVRQFDLGDVVGVVDLLVTQMDESLPRKSDRRLHAQPMGFHGSRSIECASLKNC